MYNKGGEVAYMQNESGTLEGYALGYRHDSSENEGGPRSLDLKRQIKVEEMISISCVCLNQQFARQ